MKFPTKIVATKSIGEGKNVNFFFSRVFFSSEGLLLESLQPLPDVLHSLRGGGDPGGGGDDGGGGRRRRRPALGAVVLLLLLVKPEISNYGTLLH